MKSLKNIYTEKNISHLERGVDGITRQVTRTFKHKYEVKTINAGLRFVHLIVDGFIFQVIFQILQIVFADNHFIVSILGLVMLLSYPFASAFFEYKFQQTPGKMITNHIVINEFAEKPDFRTCLLRAAIRYVPFEAFSCATSPSLGWHDKWTNTYVVNKKDLPKLKALIEKNNPVVA